MGLLGVEGKTAEENGAANLLRHRTARISDKRIMLQVLPHTSGLCETLRTSHSDLVYGARSNQCLLLCRLFPKKARSNLRLLKGIKNGQGIAGWDRQEYAREYRSANISGPLNSSTERRKQKILLSFYRPVCLIGNWHVRKNSFHILHLHTYIRNIIRGHAAACHQPLIQSIIYTYLTARSGT